MDKKSPRGVSMETYPILHPHRILTYLFDEVQLELDPASVHQYWDHARLMQEPWAVSSPASRDHVPLGLHGDGARLWTVYQVEKQMSISINLPLFRPRATRYSRFVVFTCPAGKLFKNRTLNAVFRRLAWSINACFDGFYPTQGVGGKPLKGSDANMAGRAITKNGLRFALTEVRGDWEFHRDCWRPTSSWLSTTKPMCIQCPAVASGPTELLYYNNEDSCTWNNQEFNLGEFVSQRLRDKNLCI